MAAARKKTLRRRVSPAFRERVRRANVAIARAGLAQFTFGNASAIDRTLGVVVIKPSGVPYEKLRAATMVVTDLDGNVLEGKLKPSSDLATHLELYRAFTEIGGIVHTHSRYATSWAQAGCDLPCYGTTHADYFRGPVPVTRALTDPEIRDEYERNTGRVIVERFRSLNPIEVPAILVHGHASFVWGVSIESAVENASILEEVARLALLTSVVNADSEPLRDALVEKHFKRKHGPDAYYGQ